MLRLEVRLRSRAMGDRAMATFIVLGNLTDQGGKSLRDLPKQVAANMDRAKRLGINIRAWYMVEGQYDFVIVAEAPDAETMLLSSAAVTGTGNVRTQTLRAFTLDEATALLAKMG
jgi:uncharacterized protein with GYD domain